MAERRMFAKTIIDSDAFLDMPTSARLLYYDLGMRADDDGFVNSPKKIMRTIGASNDDMNILIAKKFIIPFENGIVVIKHWRIHNYIRKDTYNETTYKNEMKLLAIDENKAYTLKSDHPELAFDYGAETDSQRPVDDPSTQVNKDNKVNKFSEDKKKGAPRFVPPSVEEVRAYCIERKNHVDPEAFVDYYERQGWVLSNGQKMKDWKSGVRTWEKRDKEREEQREEKKGDFYRIMEHKHTEEQDKRDEQILLRKGKEKWRHE